MVTLWISIQLIESHKNITPSKIIGFSMDNNGPPHNRVGSRKRYLINKHYNESYIMPPDTNETLSNRGQS